MRRTALLVLAAVTACAHGASAAFDPVGTYAYRSTADGQPVSGTITISGTPGAYTAVMTTSGVTRDLLFRTVTVTGRDVAMEAELPNARAAVRMTVDGRAVRGTWTLGPRTGELRGTKSSG